MDKKIITGLALLIIVILAVIYLLFPLGMISYFTDRERLVNLISEHKAYAALIFTGLQALQVVAAPVPGEVTGIVGGMIFGTLSAILYSTIGLAVGSWAAFALSRIAGRPLVEKIVSQETITRYDYVMKHKGKSLAFLMFLIPGFPKDILCYLLGLGHMSQRDFLTVSTSGRLLGTVLLTIEGSFLRDKRYAAFFIVLGISLVVILFVMINRENIEKRLRAMWARQRREQARNGKQDKD